MKFTLTIECDNAAFEENPGAELEQIFRQVRVYIGDLALVPREKAQVFDSNGNRVGSWEVTR